jgi:hypothetical protein
MQADYLDLYCERIGPGLAGEPLNALTNLAFFAAALICARATRRLGADFRALAALLALVGAGSLLFHTVASRTTALADLLAIAFFIWFYLQRLLVRAGGLTNVAATAAVAAYAATSFGFERAFPPGTLNGSIGYLPALATLLLVTGWMVRRHGPGAGHFVFASAAFVVALTLRTVDAAVCDVLPTGTHFLWHLLNAMVLGSLVLGLGRSVAAGCGRAPAAERTCTRSPGR